MVQLALTAEASPRLTEIMKNYIRGTLQKDKVTVSDVRVASDATSVTSVQRTVKTGEKISVPCIEGFMDQLRGCYEIPQVRLLLICITNSYILYIQYSYETSEVMRQVSYETSIYQTGAYLFIVRGIYKLCDLYNF